MIYKPLIHNQLGAMNSPRRIINPARLDEIRQKDRQIGSVLPVGFSFVLGDQNSTSKSAGGSECPRMSQKEFLEKSWITVALVVRGLSRSLFLQANDGVDRDRSAASSVSEITLKRPSVDSAGLHLKVCS